MRAKFAPLKPTSGRHAAHPRAVPIAEEEALVKGSSLELLRGVVIPAHGSVTVYSQTTEFDGSSTDDYVWLNVRTNSFE